MVVAGPKRRVAAELQLSEFGRHGFNAGGGNGKVHFHDVKRNGNTLARAGRRNDV
jgi:hypothetical protein